MDFSQLTYNELNEFLHLHGIHPSPLPFKRITQARDLFKSLKSTSQYTLPVLDLYLASQFLTSNQSKDFIMRKYTLDDIEIPLFQQTFSNLFKLEISTSNFIHRVTRILTYLGCLDTSKRIGSLWDWMVPINTMPIPISYPVTLKFELRKIEAWRSRIGIESGLHVENPIVADDLKILFDLYNRYFFNNTLPITTILKVSHRLTKTGGLCSTRGSEHKITISAPIFQNLSLTKDQATESCGLRCLTVLECLQVILEHEMIHLIIQSSPLKRHQKESKIYGAHGSLFKHLAHAYFGHTQTTHNIGRIIPLNQTLVLSHKKTTIGLPVSYITDHKLFKGVIIRTSKTTAKILLSNGAFSRVPYQFLSPLIDPELDLLSTQIQSKITYYHTLHQNDIVTFTYKGTQYSDTVQKLLLRSYEVITISYKIPYLFLVI